MPFFDVNTLPVSRWRNGGGETREIISAPAVAGEGFAWRASIATIAQAGDFSAFPGVDRIITLLEGSGVSLVFPAFSHRLRRGEPLFFAGETPLSATPIETHDGEAVNRDFNIMTRRDSHYATVMAVRDAMQLGAQEAGVLYVMDGCWRIGEETCQAGQGVWWTSQQPQRDLTPLTEDAWLLYTAVFRRESQPRQPSAVGLETAQQTIA
ncbi:HutD/Ves family protein [Pectobacterium cacticida]|uniref:HutD/Ves family protein n=1 Tax=Pectobacterium cacticida TaxID=69221 RepID=UPI00398893A7